MTSTCPNDQHHQHHQDHQGDDQQEDDQHHQGDDQHLPDQQQHHQDHPVGAGTMQESKPLVSVTNRAECHLESTILVWVSFRSIRDEIGPWRACCVPAMG